MKELLSGLEIRVTLQLGVCEVPISEVLLFARKKCVRLNRVGSEPMDLVVDGDVIARGEVVLMNGCYAFEVSEVSGARTQAS